MKRALKFLTSRLFIFSVLILLQILLIAFAILYLTNDYVYFYAAFTILSLVIVIHVINKTDNPMFKLAWIIPILLFPVFGGLFYLFFGRRGISKKMKARMQEAFEASERFLPMEDGTALEALEAVNPMAARQARYIAATSCSPVYLHTSTELLTPGETFWESLLKELRRAERYIFLEYFIIKEGRMWDSVLSVLKERAAAGVEVWVIYDDVGSINCLPDNYAAALRRMGFKAAVFNPFHPSPDVFMNYRDHRKLAIIDGRVGFTGGINLADEYVNIVSRFGYWKDTSMRLEGDAVDKLALMFLQTWHFTTGEQPDYPKYLTAVPAAADGFVQPFDDSPVNNHLTSELAYINMINTARRYVYISTPYLILDNEMITALTLAAESGVDVRIVTPYVADKKLIRLVTRSNYKALLKRGVHIYEYTPGFMHAKTIIVDDELSIVGTTNFDFRSFYLHFENGVWMYKSKCIEQVKADYLKNLAQSQEITMDFYKKIPIPVRIVSSIMKLFSPLM